MTTDDHTSDKKVTLKIIEDALGSEDAQSVRDAFDDVGERIPDEAIRAIWKEGVKRTREAWANFQIGPIDVTPEDLYKEVVAPGSPLRDVYETEVQKMVSWLLLQFSLPRA